eukprot:TRINITY_DN1237_c0_g1_i1.p1 TRINITY_DN1237_c0_g1~~TRINITY_DN1237_c0_g1_i1.p1  ORF type:complete len:103 (-),score=16.46 TRINITY_DN1237_c0_g1_i1:272-580(-)
MSTKAVEKDPRRPELIYAKKNALRPVVEDALGDLMGLLSLVFGMFGLMMKSKIFAWLALFTSFISITNTRTPDAELKQTIVSLTFSFMSLVVNYFGPNANRH